jgi:alpha-L-fucosidase 2
MRPNFRRCFRDSFERGSLETSHVTLDPLPRAVRAAALLALLQAACSPGQDVVLGRGELPSRDAAAPTLAAQYHGIFTAPPTLVDTDQTTDAPLLGNGDLGVSILNGIDAMTFVLGKNEFWTLEGSVKAMARVSLSIPSMQGSSYSMSQNIGPADVTGTFALGEDTIVTKTWVQADDTRHNQLLTTFSYTGTAPQAVTVSLAAGHGNTFASAVASEGDALYLDVRADATDQVKGYTARQVRVAARVIGATGAVVGDQLVFTLEPGHPATLVSCVMSNEDDADYKAQAISVVASLRPSDVESESVAHEAHWDAFWRKSFIEIPDKEIEKEYYGSLYLLASASRSGEAAPGMWGNWVMKNPAWFGDYALDFNYEAPFYSAFAANHVELADAYDKPIIDWLPLAQTLATERGFTGALYRVHIGPPPNGSADPNEWNMKSIGAFAATDMLQHYYATRDPAYAQAIYETIRSVGVFWRDYLVSDGTRYLIENDAQQEGDEYPQTNGVMSLGLVRSLLRGAIDISTELGIDAALRADWQDRLDKLSAFPTFMRNGTEVFRYTEVGRDWFDSNSVGSQHIYPGLQLGLASDLALLEVARSTIDELGRWNDAVGSVTFYPAAAIVGHDPADILNHLGAWIANNTYPNLHVHTGGAGIANLNTVPATINELLLQSFQGKVRVFANWPAGADARFGDLRAFGAFLVSSEARAGVVQYVRIVSERGQPLTLINPWPAATALRLWRDGKKAEALAGPELSITTSLSEVLNIAPDSP